MSGGGDGLWQRLLAAAAPDCPPADGGGGDDAASGYGGGYDDGSGYGGDGYGGIGDVYDKGGDSSYGYDDGGGDDGHVRHRTLGSVLYSRLLAAAGGDPCGGGSGHLDYTVLSVGMWTLALILVVETARHHIDKKAHNRPFFRTVLEGMYRELATLGIVESVIFILHMYVTNFNVAIEQVFAKVHFLLFFTAVINSIMSVILAAIASRISNRMWVQTEELELNHYIAIREEFDRVETTLRYMSTERHVLSGTRGGAAGATAAARDETVYSFNRRGLRLFWNGLVARFRYPLLKRKHDRLLTQVRFHELRVHFLRANNLPLKFRVSDYLKKSEIHVFKKMVHISTFAWITVASCVNLMYFLMGITAYVTSSEETVSVAMGSIYLGGMVIFVPLAWIIQRKMTWIFHQIMQMKLIDKTAPDDDGDEVDDSSSDGSYDQGEGFPSTARRSVRTKNREKLKENRAAFEQGSLSKRGLVQGNQVRQLDLFWGGDPHLVIGAFQFMQLGYAIAGAILLIFWNDIQWKTFNELFLVVLLVCYGMFVWAMSQVVPRYTLCTSLGQLVNRRRLHETMAKFKLEEAKRKRRHRKEEEKIELRLKDSLLLQKSRRPPPPPPPTKRAKLQQKSNSLEMVLEKSADSLEKMKNRAEVAQEKMAEKLTGFTNDVQRAGAKALGAPLEEDAGRVSGHGNGSDGEGGNKTLSEKGSETDTAKMARLAELVQTRTEDLPTARRNLPRQKTVAEIRTERRKNRMKSMSDGVQLMRQLGESVANFAVPSGASDAAAKELETADDGWKRKDSVPNKSQSFRASQAPQQQQQQQTPAASGAGGGGAAGVRRVRSAEERRRLRKTQSENVALMRSPQSSFFGVGVGMGGGEEKEEETAGGGGGVEVGLGVGGLIGGGRRLSQGEKSSSVPRLSVLMEDIPSRSPSAGASGISVPVGRKGTEFCEEKKQDAEKGADLPPGEVGAIGVIGAAAGAGGAMPPPSAVTEEGTSEDVAEEGTTAADPSEPHDQQRADQDDGGVDTSPPSKPLSDIASGDGEEEDDDDDTVNTNESDGSGHSDFNDVPEVAPSELGRHKHEQEAARTTWRSRFEHFFLSSKYRFLSGTCGTLVVFFVIGMRVEVFLVEGPNEIISDNENTWHLTAKSSFYMEVSWLAMFLVVSLCGGAIFAPKSCPSSSSSSSDDVILRDRDSVKMTVAIVSDAVLTALCLLLLLWAESRRPDCCKNQDGHDVCYEFGSRLCGGLGDIEPWTSVIALRVLRFAWGRLVVRCVLKWKTGQKIRRRRRPDIRTSSIALTGHAERMLHEDAADGRGGGEGRSAMQAETSVTTAQAVFMTENHMPKSLEGETGTIVELWKLAISVYPDVAERYGEFSGELLQAMLGIEILPDEGGTSSRRNMAAGRAASIDGSSRGEDGDGRIEEDASKTVATAEETTTSSEDATAVMMAAAHQNSKKYRKLNPDVQSIVLAGQIGKSVKCLPAESSSADLGEGGSGERPLSEEYAMTTGSPLSPPSSSQKSLIRNLQFEVDRAQDDHDDDRYDDVLGMFANPNARLIRSMRRCERRLPPMLDKWAVVDVVLTSEELVYFDARDVDGLCDALANMDPVTLKKMNDVKAALFATRGGKGLRLRDVAIGRKVVGHLELEDVEVAKVECLSPMDEAGWFMGGDNAVEEEVPSSFVTEEYWKASTDSDNGVARQSRNQRWRHVTEHRLKLQSMQGSLFLRFHSDLEDAEDYAPDGDGANGEGHVHKNDAILWCQTVARLCGSDQLRQDLTHLGEEGDGDGELRDFLEFVDRGAGGEVAGVAGMKPQLAIRKVVTNVVHRPNLIKRSGSFVHRRSSLAGSGSRPVSRMSSTNDDSARGGNGHNKSTSGVPDEDDGTRVVDGTKAIGTKKESAVRFRVDVEESARGDGGFVDEESAPPDLPV